MKTRIRVIWNFIRTTWKDLIVFIFVLGLTGFFLWSGCKLVIWFIGEVYKEVFIGYTEVPVRYKILEKKTFGTRGLNFSVVRKNLETGKIDVLYVEPQDYYEHYKTGGVYIWKERRLK